MRRFLFAGTLLAALILALSLPGCGGSKGPTIICTTTIVADIVKNVAGEHQDIGVLMPAGVDPHLYVEAPGDFRKLSGAKIVFYSGLHLEGKMTDLLEDMAKKKPVIAVAEKIDQKRVRKDEQGHVDPHVWFDVDLWAQTTDVVADALADFDPQHASDYRANAKSYKAKLLALHEEMKKELAAIPKKQRVLVTAHDAFEYFGRAYEIEVRAVQGISTDSEAGLQEVEKLVDFLTQNRIKAIFVESSVSDKNVKALQEGCKNRGHKVKIGGELYSDSLGDEDTPSASFEGTIRHNVETIVNALK